MVAEVEKCFAEPPTFGDYDDVSSLGAASPRGGFVQAMLGSVSDVERERELSRAFVTSDTDMRPRPLGGIVGIGDEGRRPGHVLQQRGRG